MGKSRHVVLHKSNFNAATNQTEQIDEEYIICDVCGHANPITKHECELCSNFLEEEEKHASNK